MIVYADVLIFLNLIVDYFLLSISAKIIKKNPTVWKTVLASFVGALSSLYIFCPVTNVWLETAVKFIFCFAMAFIAFGFGGIKNFLRNSTVLFLVFCGYAGVMAAVWFSFRPNGMLINNSVVYFNISPTFLVVFTVITYFVFTLFKMIFSKNAEYSEKCSVFITANNRQCNFEAIIDTGNSIEDIYGKSEIIIVDKVCIEKLFGSADFFSNEISPRYRLIPCGTVMGNSFLDGVRCDSGVISANDKKITLNKPILAVSKLPLKEGFEGIVNPKIID